MIGSSVIAVEIPADLLKVSQDENSTRSRFPVYGENLTYSLAIIAIPPPVHVRVCVSNVCIGLTLSLVFLSDAYSACSYVKVWIKHVANYRVTIVE